MNLLTQLLWKQLRFLPSSRHAGHYIKLLAELPSNACMVTCSAKTFENCNPKVPFPLLWINILTKLLCIADTALHRR